MRVLINLDEEIYPQTTMLFGDREIRFPCVPLLYEKTAGVEVPDEIAERWRTARDNWRDAQQEAESFLGVDRDELSQRDSANG